MTFVREQIKIKKKLPYDKLKGWEFILEFNISGEKFIATRPIDENIIFIEGNTANLNILPGQTLLIAENNFSLGTWLKTIRNAFI